jgi:Sulfotransferase family
MSKIVFIVSLGHSGSTLLNLLLGGHPRAISMGEIWSAIKRWDEEQRPCTCGNPVQKCPVWSQFQPANGYINSYNRLLQTIEDLYGPDKIIIDSSKFLSTLRFLIENNIKNIKILFLIKDVRSFVVSQINRKSYEHGNEARWKKSYRDYIFYNIYSWHKENRAIKRYLEKNNLEFFQFGYEELCLHSEEILKKICQFIGVDYSDRMLSPANSFSHIIRGNEMRFDNQKLKGIVYDYRWFLNKKIASNPLFYPFLNWNNKNVYLNTK